MCNASFSGVTASAREGEVDMEAGERGGNEGGGSEMGSEQAGLHPVPGAGTATDQEVPVGPTTPP